MMKKLNVSYALRITIIYALAGIGWIVFSDQLVSKFFSDPAKILAAQTCKGWSYVAVTALFIFILTKKNQSAKDITESAEKMYRMLVETLPAVVFMDKFNDPQTTQYMSPRIKDLLGYSPEEWAAADNIWESSLHPEDRQRVIAEDAHTDKTGKPFNIEYRLRHRDGHYLWINESASLIRDENGEPLFWQGFMADITLQKESAIETQRHLKELIILHAVAQVQSTADNLDQLILRITDIIGSTLYPDNCGVLLVNAGGDQIAPHFSYRGIKAEDRVGVPLTVGVAGKSVAAGMSILLGDVLQDEEYYEVTRGIKSELCVPIIRDLKTIGVINVESREPNAFTRSDERLLNTIAGGMVNFIKRMQLFDLEKKRRQEAEVLREATSMLTASFNLDTLFENIFTSLEKLISYDSAFIEMINGEFLDLAAGRNIPAALIGRKTPFDSEKWGGVDALRQPAFVSDVQLEQHFTAEERVAAHPHGWMRIPLFAQNKIVGFLNLDSQTANVFNAENAAVAQTFANQAAIVIDNVRLFQEESRRSKIIEALANIANEIASAQDAEPALDKIAQLSLSLLNASTLAIYLIQDDHQTIKIVSALGEYHKEFLSHTINIGEGVTGSIIANGAPEIIADMTNDSRRKTVPGTPEEETERDTMMSAPLILHGKPIGAINAWRKKTGGVFDKSELNFLVNIAHQASITIEAARLFQEARRRAQESAAIAEVGRDISATLHLDIVLERIATYAKVLLNSDASAIYLAEVGKLSLRAIAAVGTEAEEIKADPVQQGEGILGNIALRRSGEIVNNTAEDPRTIIVKGTQIDLYEHIMGAPVFSKDQLTGLLVVWRSGKDNEFRLSDLEFLSSLAQQAAVAIENARLYGLEQKRREEAETVRQAATALTNLLNISSLHEAIFNWLYRIVPYDSAAILEIEGDRVRLSASRRISNFEEIQGQTFSKDNALFKIIAETGEPLVVADCFEDDRFENWGETNYVRGWVGVPLISRGQTIGFITVDSCAPNAYTQDDAAVLQTFAYQAAASLENTRLFAETRQRLSDLEIVSRVSFSLRAAHEMKEMFPILLGEIKSSMDTDSVGIWLYNKEQDALAPMVVSGKFEILQGSTFKPHEGVVGKVYASGVSHISGEFFDNPARLPNDDLPHKDSLNQNEFGRSTYIYGFVTEIVKESDFFGERWLGIVVPIRTASDSIGALAVALRKPNKLETHHVRLLTTLAEIAGNAISRSNLYERGEEQIARLTILRELDTAIISSIDLGMTLNIFVENILAQMNVDAASVLVFNPDSQMLECSAAGGFNHRELLRAPIGIGSDLTSEILLNHQAQHISRVEAESSPRLKALMEKEKFTSYYAVPLYGKGATKGIVEAYFRAPFSPTADWKDFMNALAGQAIIAIDNAQLFENLQRSNQELSLAYDTTLEGWGKALELRDKETQGHTRRVTDLTLELARLMDISEAEMVNIRRGALLHDIGKMGVPDSILRKGGELTKEEKAEMRKHPQYAYDMLSPIHYLRSAIDIAYCHHEWWDGSGYPRGLAGEQIPLSARIFAVIDVWDALLSDRPYRAAWTSEKTLKYIKDLSGKQFDSRVVEAFCKLVEKL